MNFDPFQGLAIIAGAAFVMFVSVAISTWWRQF